MEPPSTIVAHLAPDLDCIAAIWIFKRFGGAQDVKLRFVPAGATLDNLPADSDPSVVHVDTGHGRFDHHQRHVTTLSAAELVRRTVASHDVALERMVRQVTIIDNGLPSDRSGCDLGMLADSFNILYEDDPERVVALMLPALDAWYAHEVRQAHMAQAFTERIEFHTPWGRGIAVESPYGGSSTMAYRAGAVLSIYRHSGHGWMGVAAQARSQVDLRSLAAKLAVIDANADWYLHPSHRLLLCGTAKAPAKRISRLSLRELIEVIESL
ncbi:MAG: hypothetical protein ACK5GU_05365 [Chloroflexota bacterium]